MDLASPTVQRRNPRDLQEAISHLRFFEQNPESLKESSPEDIRLFLGGLATTLDKWTDDGHGSGALDNSHSNFQTIKNLHKARRYILSRPGRALRIGTEAIEQAAQVIYEDLDEDDDEGRREKRDTRRYFRKWDIHTELRHFDYETDYENRSQRPTLQLVTPGPEVEEVQPEGQETPGPLTYAEALATVEEEGARVPGRDPVPAPHRVPEDWGLLSDEQRELRKDRLRQLLPPPQLLDLDERDWAATWIENGRDAIFNYDEYIDD
jgi:hypothetical protein